MEGSPGAHEGMGAVSHPDTGPDTTDKAVSQQHGLAPALRCRGRRTGMRDSPRVK